MADSPSEKEPLFSIDNLSEEEVRNLTQGQKEICLKFYENRASAHSVWYQKVKDRMTPEYTKFDIIERRLIWEARLKLGRFDKILKKSPIKES